MKLKPEEDQLNLFDEIIVDNFAGGGGASTGIYMALGRSPEIAINHDIEAIRMHEVNHPDTKHFCESVWDVEPRIVCEGRPVGLVWLSPDCKHFSKAKGSKPVDKNISGRPMRQCSGSGTCCCINQSERTGFGSSETQNQSSLGVSMTIPESLLACLAIFILKIISDIVLAYREINKQIRESDNKIKKGPHND